MTAGRWRDRVRKAWQGVDETRDRSEAEVRDAGDNFWRALLNRPAVPPEVRDARIAFERHRDEWMEDGNLDDPVQQAVHEELMSRVTATEHASGIHTHCGHDYEPDEESSTTPDDEVSGDWFAEQRAKTWGVIQPDGTVVAKGFLGDADAQEDMAVHPPGAIAVHGVGGWTSAATGHPASDGPVRRPDEDPPPPPLEPQKTIPSTGGTTTGSTGSTGGTGMPNILDARSAIMSGHQSAEQALNELMQAHRSLEDSQNGLRQGTEGSNQAEADQAHAQLTEALNKIDEARQQVASALQEFENVANRL